MRLLSVLILVFLVFPAHAAEQSFESWVAQVKTEALNQGIDAQIINQAFADISPVARIIELDRKQPEGTMTFAKYRKRVISDARIAQGRRLYRENRALLDQIAAQYGVQPQYVVALWGIETSYGNNTGGFDVIEALATLAYDGRRAKFFRSEMFKALKILNEGHITPSKMKGSWAGAMGQNQFMPSSFDAYAVDGNGDGKRDIWTSLPDVFASSSNYLAKHGWRAGERWGRAVRLPAGFSKALTGREIKKSLSEWQNLGVRLPGGGDLPRDLDMRASIVTPDGLGGPAFLVYNNFNVIMRWNKSTYFATSVGLLADAIAQ